MHEPTQEEWATTPKGDRIFILIGIAIFLLLAWCGLLRSDIDLLPPADAPGLFSIGIQR